jgi:nitrogen fixation protein FixH
VQLPEGRTAQGYVSPGTTGSNEVHVTFFDRSGAELAVKRTPRMTATARAGELASLSVRRLGAGHFVADAMLQAGAYRFDVEAAVPESARACFEERIR